MKDRVFDLSGKLRGKSFRIGNSSIVNKALAMHSVKKIVAKQFLTKDMKEKVLERLEFRKIMKHKESDSVHTYYETALRRTFNTLTHS